MREVYWIGDRFIVEWEDGRVEEFEVEKIEELKKELNLRDRIEFELSMIEREVEKEELGEEEEEKRIKEELKVNWERIKMNISELMYDLEECKLEVESVLWEIVCDKRGVESVEDLDDRLLLVECMDDFYGGDNWELFKWWMELEEVFMWLYDLSNE